MSGLSPAAAAVLSIAALLFAGTARAEIIDEPRAVAGFEAVSVRGGIDLVVRQSGREALQLRGDAEDLRLVETRVETGAHGRTLVIGPRKGESLSPRRPIRATLDVATLKAVSGSGSGDLQLGALATPALHLELAGSGDARLEGLATESLDIRIAGSSDVRASGRATRMEARIAGSGDLQSADLQSDEVALSIAGSGDAHVHAAKRLTVSIAGSGDVRYRGEPAVSTSIVGSGRVARQ